MSASSGGARQQLGQPDQIERGTREHEEPVDLGQPPQLDLPHPGDGLQPAKGRFDARPRMLTLRVAVMTRRARVDGAAATPRHVLSDVRRGVQLAHQPDEIAHIVRLSYLSRNNRVGRQAASRRDSLQTIFVMQAAEDRLRDDAMTVRNPMAP